MPVLRNFLTIVSGRFSSKSVYKEWCFPHLNRDRIPDLNDRPFFILPREYNAELVILFIQSWKAIPFISALYQIFSVIWVFNKSYAVKVYCCACVCVVGDSLARSTFLNILLPGVWKKALYFPSYNFQKCFLTLQRTFSLPMRIEKSQHILFQRHITMKEKNYNTAQLTSPHPSFCLYISLIAWVSWWCYSLPS